MQGKLSKLTDEYQRSLRAYITLNEVSYLHYTPNQKLENGKPQSLIKLQSTSESDQNASKKVSEVFIS